MFTEAPTNTINNVYELPSIEHAVRNLHGAAVFATKTTWLKAIRSGTFVSWPLINVKHVNKYFPESEETQKGHMRNIHENTQSNTRAAKRKSNHNSSEAHESPKISETTEEINDIFIKVYDHTHTMYTDQTGKFPVRSSRGQQYIVVSHHVDSNWTLIETTSHRTEGGLIGARRRILSRMKKQGIVPKHQVLDNEISTAYVAEIELTKMTYQLMLPNDHRHNIEEKAIQTWKDHFVGVISGTTATFPRHLWCQAIPQAERQLMLLRHTNTNPKIYTYAHV